jgi:predicted RNA-binding protein with PUA-like domain
MANFLFKTEPTTYSFEDLVRDKTTVWDGVSNAVALKHMRTVKKGDTIAIYHTGDEKQVVGLATADSDPFPDPKLKDPKRVVVRLKAGRALPFPVPLSTFRSDDVLKTTELVRLPRLSVMPLSAEHHERMLERSGMRAGS